MQDATKMVLSSSSVWGIKFIVYMLIFIAKIKYFLESCNNIEQILAGQVIITLPDSRNNTAIY